MYFRECSQYLLFFPPILGWKVVLVDFFKSWILSGSSIKQCWCLENFEAWAGDWPASNLSAPARPVKSSTSPPLSQLTELWDNISFLSLSWPFCSLRKEGDGLYWPCSLRCSFFGNWTSETKGFSGVSPRGCGACTCVWIKTLKRLVVWRGEINSKNWFMELLAG